MIMKVGRAGLMAMVAALAAAPAAAEFGAKAGASIANVMGVSDITADSVTGLTGGAFLSLSGGVVAVEADVLFTAKGYKFASTVGGSALTVVNEFNYIDVPVLVKFYLIPKGPFRPYLGAGPQVSFLMSAESKSTLNNAETKQDVKDALAHYDWAAVLDGGVSLVLGAVTLSADFRYGLGLTGISKTAGEDGKSSVISILAGVAF